MSEYEFKKTTKITFAESNAQNEIKLSNILRHVGDISSEHLEELKLPYEMLWNEGFVFLLTRLGMRITRRPKALETVTIVTSPRKPRGVQMTRDVTFYAENGEELITAQTAWVLADPKTHKICRPKEFPHTVPIDPLFESDYALIKEKLRRGEGAKQIGERVVRYSDIDCNDHMNNAVYADIICDFLPVNLHRERALSECHISFVGEARLGSNITIFSEKCDEDTYYIGADRCEGDRCFEAILKYKP